MKAQELRQLIREEIGRILNEGKKTEKLLAKVIEVVKDEYNKGNKNNYVDLMDVVEQKTGYNVRDYSATNGPAKGMPAFMVGNFMVLVSLANKPTYKSELDSFSPRVQYIKIGDWWIRTWD